MPPYISPYTTSYLFKRAIRLAIAAWCLPIAGAVFFVSQGGDLTGGDTGDSNGMAWAVGFPYFFGFIFAAGGFASAIGADASAWSNPEYKRLKTIALWSNGLYFWPSVLLFMAM
jgi:hypothetical protein